MKTAYLLLICALTAGSVLAAGSDVLILDPTNFDQEIGGDQPALVEFFAPWCGHCKSLAPEYDVLATTWKGHPVKIASVDADKHRDLGGRFEVSGFPTIKYFPAGSKTPEAYQGGRTAPDMTDFLSRKTGLHVRIKTAPTAVTVLDPSNFDSIVMDPTKNVLVEFYAPWCGHCKQLTPKYEKVAQSFEGDDNIVIAKLDADAHKDLGQRYGVSGYPTIKFFPTYSKNGEDYSGGREAEDFVRFINDKAGAQRTLGGGWTEQAGRIESLDALAVRFVDAESDDDKKKILTEAATAVEGLATNQKDWGRVYEMVMRRVLEKGASYPAAEAARMKRILEGGNVSAKKKADFAKRRNIISQFIDD